MNQQRNAKQKAPPAGTNGSQADTAMAVAKNEETQNGMAKVEVGKAGLSLNNLNDMYRFAQYLVKSGMAPKNDNPEAIVIKVQFGMEVGLGPMQSVTNISCINNSPAIWGDAALALVKSKPVFGSYFEEATDDELHAIFVAMVLEEDHAEKIKLQKGLMVAQASLKMDHDDFGFSAASYRKGQEVPVFTRFTISDAKQAKLWQRRGHSGQDTPWVTFPRRMLMWRARGFNLRDNFGDVLKGLLTTEEAMDIELLKDIGHEVDGAKKEGPMIHEAGGTKTDALASKLRVDTAIKGPAFPDKEPATVDVEPEDVKDPPQEETPADPTEPLFGESDEEAKARKTKAKAKKGESKLHKGRVSVQ